MKQEPTRKFKRAERTLPEMLEMNSKEQVLDEIKTVEEKIANYHSIDPEGRKLWLDDKLNLDRLKKKLTGLQEKLKGFEK